MFLAPQKSSTSESLTFQRVCLAYRSSNQQIHITAQTRCWQPCVSSDKKRPMCKQHKSHFRLFYWDLGLTNLQWWLGIHNHLGSPGLSTEITSHQIRSTITLIRTKGNIPRLQHLPTTLLYLSFKYFLICSSSDRRGWRTHLATVHNINEDISLLFTQPVSKGG